jgi:glycosyltransferase involved in cell wall biosynthesis
LCAAAVLGADRVGTVARSQVGEVRSLLGSRIFGHIEDRLVDAPMGIDVDTLQTSRPRQEIRDELGLRGFTVVFIGRLVEIKGLDLLVEAIAGRQDWQLVVAGDGPRRAELERLAEARRIDARFCGSVGSSRRAELLAAGDALALPSRRLESGRHEGLPLVLLEAMGAGLPVVAAETGGIVELVADGANGLLVPPDDPASLGLALARLAERAQLRRRLADAARGVALERDWRQLSSRYEELLGLGRERAP